MKTAPVILVAAITALAMASVNAQQPATTPPPPAQGDRPTGPGGPPPPRGERPPGDRPNHGPGDREVRRGRDDVHEEGQARGEGRREDRAEGRGAGREEGMRREGRRGLEGEERRGPRIFLGVMTAPLPAALAAQLGLPEGFGLLVQDVMPDSPAAKAGVVKFDVLKLLNDQQLVDPRQLMTLLTAAGKDKAVELTIVRKGQEQKVTATLEERQFPRRDGRSGGGPEARGAFREAREQLQNVEERMREMRERVRDRMERARKREDRPQAGAGLAAEAESIAGVEIPPEQLLEQARRGGEQLRVETQSSSTTVDGNRARLFFKDRTGEIEVKTEDGKRVLTARDAAGKQIFSGPVNTPEERAAVPPEFQAKLDKIHLSPDGRNLTALGGSSAGPSVAAIGGEADGAPELGDVLEAPAEEQFQ